MKKWRSSRRCSFDRTHLTANDVFTDDKHRKRKEYFRILGKLAWQLGEVDVSSSANLAVG